MNKKYYQSIYGSILCIIISSMSEVPMMKRDRRGAGVKIIFQYLIYQDFRMLFVFMKYGKELKMTHHHKLRFFSSSHFLSTCQLFEQTHWRQWLSEILSYTLTPLASNHFSNAFSQQTQNLQVTQIILYASLVSIHSMCSDERKSFSIRLFQTESLSSIQRSWRF